VAVNVHSVASCEAY